MNQINSENNPNPPENLPLKRRRGRPRKDPSQGVTRRVPTHPPPSLNRANNRTNSLSLDAVEDSYNGVVGQPVTGVVESSFQDGYLLSVRIGNSGTNLRGLVFKPGHYIPISAENDVAPHVQMIRRSEISLPLVRTRGRHRRSRGRNPRHMAPPELPRGNMVPVVLQPQAGQYEDPTYTKLQKSMSQGENGNFYGGGERVDLMNQVGPSGAHVSEGEDSDDVEEPLDAMPLQAIHGYVHSQQNQRVHKPMEVQRVGKMTELLQAVQENAPGNPLLGAEKLMTRNDNAQA